MVKQTIEIFLRIKPINRNKAINYELEDNNWKSSDSISMVLPRDLQDQQIDNRKNNYQFQFDKIFDMNHHQDVIFSEVAQSVVDSALQGYNATIFAYGQTGSGKTFTITGGAEKYSDRGIIPRTLNYIFAHYNKQPDLEFKTEISYLEIYNEKGYDLLDPRHDSMQKLEDLTKVTLYEDSDGSISLKNLSFHPARNEEEALNLLFIGDTNRMVAETPMNQASTRSHCIFTIHLQSRERAFSTYHRSKLHLVDLAGSERVYKTGANGQILTEAKYINVSLHFLEQVIVSLSDKKRTHIPYRNSMMTSVLRDSLGGNCRTSMIAAISVDKKNIMESVSTCRFAQRVALIKNNAVINEELDPQLIIQRLKNELASLKVQMQITDQSGESDNASSTLNEEERDRLKEDIKQYLEEDDKEGESSKIILNICKNIFKIQYGFYIMKEMVLSNKLLKPIEQTHTINEVSQPINLIMPQHPNSTKQDSELVSLLKQRDNEISILVSMLKKEKIKNSSGYDPEEMKESKNNERTSTFVIGNSSSRLLKQENNIDKKEETLATEKISNQLEEKVKTRILGNMSIGREEAFEIFKNEYPNNIKIKEQKEILRSKYIEAKTLGNTINQSRQLTNKFKVEIDQINEMNESDEETAQNLEFLRDQMRTAKEKYKEAYNSLRLMKPEIEHLQHLLEAGKLKMMKDFENWWDEKCSQIQEKNKMVKDTTDNSSLYSSESRMDSSNQKSTRTNEISLDRKAGQSVLVKYAQIDKNRQNIISKSNNHENQHEQNINLLDSTKTSNDTGILTQTTGDDRVDADIKAFVEARDRLRRFSQNKLL